MSLSHSKHLPKWLVIIIGQNTQLAWILEVCALWAGQAMALSFLDKKLIVDQIVWIRSVWIELILLKLKIKNWKYCSKIIFKCVNSTVGPIFNEKVVKKWNLWVHKQYMMHCLLQKSQYLRLLFIEQYMRRLRDKCGKCGKCQQVAVTGDT